MAKPPVLKPREVAAILQQLGFVEIRQRGSHKQYRHADGRCTVLRFLFTLVATFLRYY